MWKSIAGFLGIIATLLLLSTYVATQDDLKSLEEKTIDTFQKLQDDIDKKMDQRRYYELTDQMYRIKQWNREHPNDEDLKADYNKVLEERKQLEEKLDKQ